MCQEGEKRGWKRKRKHCRKEQQIAVGVEGGGAQEVEVDSTQRWRMKENEKERLIVDVGSHAQMKGKQHARVSERERSSPPLRLYHVSVYKKQEDQN